MKSSHLILTVALGALLAPGAARASVQRTVEKSFTVQPGGTVEVATEGGNIRVDIGADDAVKVIAQEKINADSEAEADQILKKLTLAIEQDGDRVVATAKYEQQPFAFHWGSWPPVRVDFVVTVPARFAAELKTSGGNIRVGDLNGKVQAHTSGGNERFGRIGGEVDASTSGGSISLAAGAGKVSLFTSGGDIEVGPAGGPAELRTSGGNIRIGAVTGALIARTSGGNIRATFTNRLTDDCVLATSGGEVRVTVPPGLGFRLDAATSGGTIRADGLEIVLSSNGSHRDRLAGTVAGGGPQIRLRSSGGDIEIGQQDFSH
jgi:hypothetical protein